MFKTKYISRQMGSGRNKRFEGFLLGRPEIRERCPRQTDRPQKQSKRCPDTKIKAEADFCKFVILDNCASDRVSGGRRRRAFRNRLIYFMYQQYNSVTFFLQDAYYESNAAVWNCLMPLRRNVAGFLAGREGDHVWIRIEWKIRWMRERFRFT